MTAEKLYSDPYTEEDQRKDEELFFKIQEENKSGEFKIDQTDTKVEEIYNEKKKDLIDATYKLKTVVNKKLHGKHRQIDPSLLEDESDKDLILKYIEELHSSTSAPARKKGKGEK